MYRAVYRDIATYITYHNYTHSLHEVMETHLPSLLSCPKSGTHKRKKKRKLKKSLRRIENTIMREIVATPIDLENVIETIPVKDSPEDEAKRR